MPHYLSPHTPEWFKHLEKFDSEQASLTKRIIELAGTSDVCSICGDEENVSDYFLNNAKAPADAVLTLRLCKDCLKIRKQLHGETFSPFSLDA